MPKYTISNFSGGQVNNRGPFNVEKNEARLALNTDLSKRDGSIKRRDGYTQLGAAISANPILGMESYQLAAGTIDIRGVAAKDSSNAIAVGVGGKIYTTDDGFATVTDIAHGLTSQTLIAASFSGGTTYYVCGAGGTIMVSTDDGANWADKTSVSGTTENLYSISFISTSVGIVSGDNRVVRKTSDSGASWADLDSAGLTASKRYYAHMVDASVAWLCSPQEDTYKMTDGANWVSTVTPSYAAFSIYALDGTTAWQVGTGEKISKTSDGGASFVELFSGASSSFTSIRMFDADDGWICGRNGRILYTPDGGATLVDQTTNSTSALQALWVVDASNVFCVGNGYTFLSSSNATATATGGDWSVLQSKETLVVVNNADVYVLFGATYTDITATQLTAGKEASMVEFLKVLFIANGADALRTTDGTAPILTGSAANAPVFTFIERFFDRIYGAFTVANPDRVWYSSPPLDLIAHIRGAVNATVTSLDVTSTKYIKSGDVIDIYTHATDTKIVNSLTMTAPSDEDTITFSSTAVNVADNDDIYIEDTKGTLGLKWDTSGVPLQDFIDFPGEVITGLKLYGDFLMVPCKGAMWAIDKFQGSVPVSSSEGSLTGRSLVVVNQRLYYFNQRGLWEWTGTGEPVLVSNDIKDFTDAVSTSFLESVVAWEDGDSYNVYVGELTVDGRVYSNVVLEYNTRFENWQIHSLPDVITAATQFAPAPGDSQFAYIGTLDGEVHRWKNGTSDDGTVIPLEVQTVNHYFGEAQMRKTINKIWVYAKEGVTTAIEISIDDQDYQSLGDTKGPLTTFNVNFSGAHFVSFKIRQAETNSPQIDAIIMNYQEDGED